MYCVKQRTDPKKLESLHMFDIERNTQKCQQYNDDLCALADGFDIGLPREFENDFEVQMRVDFINHNGFGLINDAYHRLHQSCITEINFLWIYNLYFDKNTSSLSSTLYGNYAVSTCSEYGQITTYLNLTNIYEGLINKKNHYQIILRIIFEVQNFITRIASKFIDKYINLYNLYFETFGEYPKEINEEITNAFLFMSNKMENQNLIEYAKIIILKLHCILSDYKYPINFLIKCFEIIKNDSHNIKKTFTAFEIQKIRLRINVMTQKEYEVLEYLYKYYKIEFIPYEFNTKYKKNLIEKIVNQSSISENNSLHILKNTIINYDYLSKIIENIKIDNTTQDKDLIMFLKNNTITYKNLLSFIKNNFPIYIYLLFENVIKNNPYPIKKRFKLNENNDIKTVSNITFDFENYIKIKKLKIKDYFIVDRKLSKLLNEPISKMLKIENIKFI
jgi:hypothetical protein